MYYVSYLMLIWVLVWPNFRASVTGIDNCCIVVCMTLPHLHKVSLHMLVHRRWTHPASLNKIVNLKYCALALQIGQQYLSFLLDQRRFAEAAALTPWLLQV